MEWIDTRLTNPSCNSYDRYVVIFKYCNSSFIGFAEWIPENNYTEGVWGKTECTNGNNLQGEVLYYLEHPKFPNMSVPNKGII